MAVLVGSRSGHCLCASVCVNSNVWGKVEDKIDWFMNSEHENLEKLIQVLFFFAIEQMIQLIRAEIGHKSLVKRLMHCSAKCYCF